MFCKKCGSILLPKKDSKGKAVMGCSCGYFEKDTEKMVVKDRKNDSGPELDVVEESDSHLPMADAECPKCGHKKAYYWLQQTRAADEPETKFMKCGKCRHIWRDYK